MAAAKKNAKEEHLHSIGPENAKRDLEWLCGLKAGHLIRLAAQLHLLDSDNADTLFKGASTRDKAEYVLDALLKFDEEFPTEAGVKAQLRKARALIQEYEGRLRDKDAELIAVKNTLQALQKNVLDANLTLLQIDGVNPPTTQPPQYYPPGYVPDINELANRVVAYHRSTAVRTVSLSIQHKDGRLSSVTLEP